MRYIVNVSGKNLALTEPQLAILMTAVQDAEQLSEKHVGKHKGSQGYDNGYVPTLETVQVHEWLHANIVSDDFIETVKLATKLDKNES